MIADHQFQAALDRFQLGRFLHAEAMPFGNFGQNIFVSSTGGDYVLRGNPHFWWQFPTEQFFARQIDERTPVPVPWPYLIDATSDIFGWSFVLMPRMSGLQIADLQVKQQLEPADRRGIAQALGENIAHMQAVTWPIAGRYNAALDTVEPFELAQELAWPFPSETDVHTATMAITPITYSQRVQACLRYGLLHAQESNATATTPANIAWVEEYIAEAQDALDEPFEPCFVMEDYRRGISLSPSRTGAGR